MFSIKFPEGTRAHRIPEALNCVEAIDRALQFTGLGRVDQINVYSGGGFVLMAAHSRMKGEVRDIAAKEIRRQGFDLNVLLPYRSESESNDDNTTR
jgi:hypothetical protein